MALYLSAPSHRKSPETHQAPGPGVTALLDPIIAREMACFPWVMGRDGDWSADIAVVGDFVKSIAEVGLESCLSA